MANRLALALCLLIAPAGAQAADTGGYSPVAPGGTKPYLPIPSFRDMMMPDKPEQADEPQDDVAKAARPEAPVDPNADLAFGAFQRGLYQRAFEEAKKRAEANPPDRAAMTLLGELYANGYGVPRKPEEAVRWYQRAADAGDPRAMTTLALARLEGFGSKKDETAAVALLEKAGEKNEAEALYNLALIELERANAPQQAAAAARRMKRAADLGEAAAQYAYAVLLREGRGVEKDPSAATEWLRRAAEQDDVAALVEYAIALFKGTGTVSNEAEAARLFRRAADRGNAIAQNRLARLYAYGRGVDRDPVKAAAWHRLSAAQGLKDPWLEGFVGTLDEKDKAAADALTARWSERFGPIPRVSQAAMTSGGETTASSTKQ
ncbi:sel1 repeat family protein [Chelatococcus sambhunathii]|uniref:Sel1 repeat family protein n=1 Tax=Chelatococcus sambhunathii TaxID=363953 RepID=A0ABU1DJF7_9HYPH|nr:sel1 repeat family protein [Chelatococcus sambhunathii]